MLVQKVYFPRLVLPLSSVLVPLVDFVFSFVVLLGIMVWFDVAIQPTLILAPFFLLLIAMTAVGVGSALAVVNVRYRDVPYTIPFLIQIWLFASPRHLPDGGDPREVPDHLRAQPGRRRRDRLPLGAHRHAAARHDRARPRASAWRPSCSSRGLMIYRRGETSFADMM